MRFPMNVLPSGLITCNQSGKEFLWVLLMKSKQLLAILHPSVFCSGEDPLEPSMHKPSLALNIRGLCMDFCMKKEMLLFAVHR